MIGQPGERKYHVLLQATESDFKQFCNLTYCPHTEICVIMVSARVSIDLLALFYASATACFLAIFPRLSLPDIN